MKIKLPIKQAFFAALANYKNNIVSILAAMIILAGSISFLTALATLLARISYAKFGLSFLGVIMTGSAVIAGILVNCGLVMGMTKFMLDITDHKELRFKTLFSYITSGYQLVSIISGLLFPVFFSLTIFSVGGYLLKQGNLSQLSTTLISGIMLFSIPLYWIALIGVYYYSIRVCWCIIILADQKLGVLQSIKISFSMTQGFWWRIFCMLVFLLSTSALITLLGIMGMLINLFIFSPILTLIYCYLYRWLSNKQAEQVN